MFVLGVTGRLGSGKSTIAKILGEKYNAAVICSDEIVHTLQQPGTLPTKLIAEKFGAKSLTPSGAVDRAYISKKLSENASLWKTLEEILHPAVRAEQLKRIQRAKEDGKELIVLDVPLLFQAGTDILCHKTLACVCTSGVRKERALQRTGMTAEKLALIDARQLSRAELEKRADYTLYTDCKIEETEKNLKKIVETCLGRS
jgi:dephospho-CoA kinase